MTQRVTKQKIHELRALPPEEVLRRLDCYIKADVDYIPQKNTRSQRFHVSVPTIGTFELLITGEKWYDTQADLGGGGAIDLIRYLYGETVEQAIQRLQKAVNGTVERERPENSAPSERLAPVRHQQGDLFVADILDWMPKDDVASMEHSLFALKAGDKRVREYLHNKASVKLLPGFYGLATIHDKDLWIYCISQLVAAKEQGREIGRTVRFTMYDFLKATNRRTDGDSYKRATEMLERLSGTRIRTNIVTPGYRERGEFGLIDSWRVVERDNNNRMVAVEVDLPNWLFCSIEAKRVLTLSRDYFRLRKPLDRRIYELARKHCGQQDSWSISIEVLHKKSGSCAALRNFRLDVKSLVDSRQLPDYLMTYDANTDEITFQPKKPSGKSKS